MIDIPYEALKAYCQRRGIQRLSIFGSALRDDFGPDSDVDLLIEFEPWVRLGWDVIDVQDELSALFNGRPIDMVFPNSIITGLKDRILSSAIPIYESASAA